jgi:hypothetical protein
MSRYSWFDSLADKLRADLESATHGGVSSVNGSAGDVVLTASDVSAQPASAALTALAGLDSSQPGVIASDGAGWLSKTYAALKTALSLVKGDVGLGNVDNTSDANKPVSTAQQTALNIKAPLASPALTGTPTAPTAAPGTNNTQLASTAYADAAAITAAVGLLDYRGTFNASGNAFPASGGSGSAGTLLKGDFWIVSTPGTLGGTAVSNGDLVIALIDAPGTTAANWDLIEHDIGYAPENVANKSTDGTLAANSATLYPSQSAVKTYADSKASPLTRTAVKVGNYTATMWDLVPCDTSGGAFTVVIPAASGGKGRIAIKLVTAGNTLNLALTGTDHFNTSAGPTTGTLTLANQGIIIESDGSGIWTITADDISLTALDARYVNETDAAPLALAGQTPSQAPVAPTAAGGVGALAVTARADHAHPSVGVYAPYGTGSDGAISIDGSATVGKFTKVTSTLFKLTGDVFATNLTIAAGIAIETAGFKVHVSGTLTGPASGTAATFQCSQPALSGTNQQTVASGTTSLVIGAGRYATLGFGQLGRGGVVGAGVVAAAPGGSTAPQYAGTANLTGSTSPGTGGSGTSGAGGAGLASPGQTVPNVNFPQTVFEGLSRGTDAAAAAGSPMIFGVLMGGIGGGSGAGDGTNAGGAGGQGGNVVIVNARIVVGKVNVTAPGQAGGTPTTGNCGGGGGGTGGAAFLNSTDLTGWIGAVSAPGGSGGTGVGTGAAGTAGVAGLAAATQWA